MTLNTGQVRDSITQPNVIDTLRRVSVVVAKHIRTGESWRREALLSARVLVSRDDSGADGRYSKRDLDRYLSTLPQWEICRQFAQDNFVSPQWTYHLPTSMLSAPGILFAGRPANAKRVVPQAQDIALYLGAFVSALHLEAENLIICLIYVERLMRLTDMHLLSDTWRSLLLCGLLTATKIWQDGAPKNRAFSAVFPEFSVKSVAKLERMFASALDWGFSVSGSEYANYYFSLRSLSYHKGQGQRKNFRRRLINHLKVDMPSAVAFEEKMRAKQGKPISIIPTSTQRPNPANQQSRQTLGAFVRSAGNTTPPTTSEKRQQEETKRDNAVPDLSPLRPMQATPGTGDGLAHSL